ncbi:hypothetical protein LJC19_00005, partial [Oxalobacter sp. OttesenSCG-928-P03]|nr:hypothetical protein [Oxalobacter sp. OttesenSCG-928-P03]
IKKGLAISLSCLCLFACTDTVRTEAALQPPAEKTGSVSIISASGSDMIRVTMQNGHARLKLRKKAGQSILLTFSSGDYTRMTGKLVSRDPAANVRFAQITLPDGTMDGPFGSEMSYDLPAKGDYTLRINENIMAGDPWSGECEVIITLGQPPSSKTGP